MQQFFRSLIIAIFFIFLSFNSLQLKASEQPKKKPWTILVYMNADNNLENFGYLDLHEMESIGSNENVNVVVQFDGEEPEGTKRFLVTQAPIPMKTCEHSFSSPVLEDMPEQDMGDPKTFVDFVTWGMTKFPAENYMVIMWNHGTGWQKSKDDDSIVRGISYDDTSGHHITTNQLSESVDKILEATGNHINIFAFDACLMAMFEIADALSGVASYLVASEETEPGRGIPYDDFLKIFQSNKTLSPAAVASHLVQVFGASYREGGSQAVIPLDCKSNNGILTVAVENASHIRETTISAVNLSRIEVIKRRLKLWIESVGPNGKISKDVLLKAAKDATSFDEPAYKDLGHYVQGVMDQVEAKEGAAAVSANTDWAAPQGLERLFKGLGKV